jgi:hypothetical protein
MDVFNNQWDVGRVNYMTSCTQTQTEHMVKGCAKGSNMDARTKRQLIVQ